MRNFFNISFIYHIFQSSENGEPGFIEERKNFPLLGICLGMQQLNVALGGTLIQDIPSLVYKDQQVKKVNIHRQLTKKKHAVKNPIIISDSIFEKNNLSGKKIVLHNHHQAIENLGTNLKATAFSADGKIIEAIRHDLYPNVIGVQFHPEYRSIWKKNGITKKNDQEFHKNFWQIFKKILPEN